VIEAHGLRKDFRPRRCGVWISVSGPERFLGRTGRGHDAQDTGDAAAAERRGGVATAFTLVNAGGASVPFMRETVRVLADGAPRRVAPLPGRAGSLRRPDVLVELFKAQNGTRSGTPSAF